MGYKSSQASTIQDVATKVIALSAVYLNRYYIKYHQLNETMTLEVRGQGRWLWSISHVKMSNYQAVRVEIDHVGTNNSTKETSLAR